VAISIDVAARRIDAAVGDLVAEQDQRAIGLSGSGLTRLWIGQELHARIQQELSADDPGFRAEVPVSASLEIDGWTLRLSGRADGVQYAGEQPVQVDEIKTLHFAVDLHNLYLDERLERFRRQVRLYALLLSTPERPVGARLLLVDIVTGELESEEVECDAEATTAWLRQQLHRLVAAERRRQEHREALSRAAELLRFPHPEPRPVQETIGEAVAAALGEGRHLLLRAPTGCGKTAAVLHPAVKTALSRGQRLFFLTAKTLGQRIAVDTIRAMQNGLFRSLQLRAKSKMCANAEIICHEEYCTYAKDYGLKLARSQLVRSLIADDVHQDPDRIFHAAVQSELCPFELSLDLLSETDVVVCDYNYVFDPDIGLAALLNRGALRDAVLIIDEAHNLVDRSREYYSPALGSALLERARSFLASRDNAVFRELRVLADELAELVAEVVAGALGPDANGDAVVELPAGRIGDLRLAFDGALLSYFLYKREQDLWMADDPIVELFLALMRLHRVLSEGGSEFVHLASRSAGGTETVKVCCLDASRFVGRILDESAGVVAMSATLEPFEFYRELLGFEAQRTDELYVPSPFPASNRLVVCIPDVDTTFRSRAFHYDRIADWIARLAHPDHNVLTLFPSYRFLESVRDRLPPVGHRLLVQEPSSSDAVQASFLDALASGQPQLVLAVLGGIFAESVDYPGEMLSQVIVVSPGLPQLSTERELLKAYYQESYGHGFGYAYLVPGLTRVVQAAGRIFRSDSDRGVIVLMCQRFLDRRYARLLPSEWTDDDPSSLLHEDPAAEVRRFFDQF
jgi:DNA excision repair protein ERCC-2